MDFIQFLSLYLIYFNPLNQNNLNHFNHNLSSEWPTKNGASFNKKYGIDFNKSQIDIELDMIQIALKEFTAGGMITYGK